MAVAQSQTSIVAPAHHAVTVWLALCLVMVALMVVAGGLTRLTESGLSIVEWKPMSGIFPPMNEPEWEQEFAGYQTSPQFKKSFPDMTLPEFKHIYWLEYIHRLLGRIAGVVFLAPLVWFSARRSIGTQQAFKLAGIFTLGFIQGVIGWFMVKSGLANEPHVSPYMLAFHLATGFTIFALILWETLSASNPQTPSGGFELPQPPLLLKLFACLTALLIFAQVILGAGVAGLHAGLSYNTFPLMDGTWVPEGLWPYDTWYKNLFEDVTTIQFAHRIMAYGIAVIVPLFWIAGRNNPHVAHLLPILFSIFVVQFLLGVLTLLFVVPLPLASLHQANALLLFAIAVTILHRLFIPLKYVTFEMNGKSLLA
jgi:cytochrome c oxidase assembly protein subunit 15